MGTHINLNTKDADRNQTQLEELTRKYLLGEIQLDLYREEIARLRVTFDLRKMASKIKTGSLQAKVPD